MYSDDLSDRLVAVLLAAGTLAETRVYTARTWPVMGAQLPALRIDVGDDFKQSRGRVQPPSFITTTTLTVSLSVEAEDQETALSVALELRGQIHTAVLTDNTLMSMIQQFSSVQAPAVAVSSDGEAFVGSGRVDFAMEYPEDFDSADATDAVPLTSVGIHLDLVDQFDATGTYATPTAPPYTPAPAPRASGPDGRDEAALDIDLPQ